MKRTTKGGVLRWLWGQSRGLHGRILFLMAAGALASLTMVAYALACKTIVDAAVAGQRAEVIRSIVVIALLLAAELALHLSKGLLEDRASTRLHMQLQRNAVRTLLEREHAGVSRFHSGELLNRMYSDASIVAGGITGILPSFSSMVARMVGAAAALFALAPGFMLLFLVAGVVLFLLMSLLRNPIRRLHRRMQEAQGENRAFLQEVLERLLVIRVFGAGDAVMGRLRVRQEQYARRRHISHACTLLSDMGFGLVFDFGHILALVIGSLGILNGKLGYGTMMAMVQLVGQVQSPFSGLSGLLSRYFTVTASAERLMELEELPAEPERPALPYPALRAIRFDHVDFTYGRNTVLRDVDLTIRKGDVISFTGVSGGGKSTLFLLLLGAYGPTAGAVRFLKADGGEERPGGATRSLFAYVPQGNYLLSGTLRENLTLFRADVRDEAVWDALTQACAAEFVREMPQGLETPLGEKGNGLSEGQMQRIALARALLSGAPILLLDEATSALDEATEAQVLANIAAMRDRTCLIVTHRPRALAICNRHLVLEDGRVWEKPASDETE